ncbi:serine-rich adhesin for platelets [Musca domestica]|uniref:Serine-rich adhesin for platelets n=1 Tax=Musca domestica TaxID=7370 RepID=A0ABM3UYC2_MUSDO|nr:serine-rich adhesin for platelets [Musca domestica]
MQADVLMALDERTGKRQMKGMLQTAASLIVEEELAPQADALRGQPEYAKPSSDGGTATKRRPGNRKRKRRPQVAASGGSEEMASGPTAPSPITHNWRVSSSEETFRNDFKPVASPSSVAERRSTSPAQSPGGGRRRKPATIREPLAALEKEQKLYEMRNTKTPGTKTTSSSNKENSKGSSTNRNSENVKNILKNSGGLSLSEILQQKNLSLDDLLKGKQNALQALQTTATTVSHNATKDSGARYTAKPKFKLSTTSVKSTANQDAKEHSKLTALQKLKLFGAASRPVGSQVGLVDHLTTRKKEGGATTTSTTTTTTAAPTTRIPLYKKLLHQRSTLRPAFLLKNSRMTLASVEPEHDTTTLAMGIREANSREMEEDDENFDDEDLENSTATVDSLEVTTWRAETTTTPPPTRRPQPTQITAKPITKFSTLRERANSLKELSTTRRMYSTTRGLGRATNRFTTSSSTVEPPQTTTSVGDAMTTTSQTTTTTTTKATTTTASSSTMNLTPRANLNLNTDDIRERIQETLLKNLIEKEQAFKKQNFASKETAAEEDNDDDLENFFEESVKPKASNALETSTITTRMKQYSSAIPSSTPLPPATQQTSNSIPDYDNVDDRTDLLELIEDRRSGNRLFKVLEQRNMTLDELIEHRKRGSSQLHLATIVQTPSRYYPDKKVLLQDNMDIVTAFENFPHFNLLNLKSVKPDDIKTDSQGSSYFTSIIDIEPTDEIYKKGQASPGLNEKGASHNYVSHNRLDRRRQLRGSSRYLYRGYPRIREDRHFHSLISVALLPDRSDKSLGFFPSWKTLALASLATTTTTKKDSPKQAPFYLAQPKMLLENNNGNNSDEDDYEIRENELVLINNDDSGDDNEDGDSSNAADVDYRPQSPVQAAVRVAGSASLSPGDNLENQAHDLVDLELSGHGFKRSPMAAGALAGGNQHKNFYANMPAGIKSAIVASATIVMTALVTFMVIFAVCRWKQKHSRMSNIMKSYNAMKSKLPPIAMTQTTAASAGGGNAMASTSCTRHSSLREMNSLLGGSGLSVAATITTTTTGVPNTPSPTTSQTTVALSTSTTTPTAAGASLSSGGGLRESSRKYNPLIQHSSGPQHMQRPSSLLFHRPPPANNKNHQQHQQQQQPTNLAILSNCNLSDLRRTSANDLRGSTTSLSFSLTSGHNIPSTHINSMDANSPEVQEYLFDTLRNSF